MLEPILDEFLGESGKIIIRVKGGLHNIKNNKSPYFSITANMKDSGGCLHDEIEKYFPGKYTDLISLHLSDMNGTPRHAVENGYYFYSDKQDMQTTKKHLRISQAEAEELFEYRINKEQFREMVEAMKPRWKKEAEECILKHNLIVYN
jgi:hypothetical protein